MWINPDEIPDNGVNDDNNGIVDDVFGADFPNNDGDPGDDQGHVRSKFCPFLLLGFTSLHSLLDF